MGLILEMLLSSADPQEEESFTLPLQLNRASCIALLKGCVGPLCAARLLLRSAPEVVVLQWELKVKPAESWYCSLLL